MSKRLVRGYTLLAKKSFRNEVKLKRLMWFTGVSSYKGDFEYDYSGLMRLKSGKLSEKPAYGAYQKTARSFEGCAKNSHGSCR